MRMRWVTFFRTADTFYAERAVRRNSCIREAFAFSLQGANGDCRFCCAYDVLSGLLPLGIMDLCMNRSAVFQKSQSVHNARARRIDRAAVRGGAVSFVRLESVCRESCGKTHHKTVPRHFRDDRCRRDLRKAFIGLDDGLCAGEFMPLPFPIAKK